MQVCDKCQTYGVEANDSVYVDAVWNCDDGCTKEKKFHLCPSCYKLYHSKLRKFFGVSKNKKRVSAK